jgi:ankyrin repeat protein
MAHDEQQRLTASDVLRRFKDDDLPAFAEMALTDVNQVGICGERPLDVAAVRGVEAEVVALLEGGAHVNAAGEHGNTALHEAAAQGHLAVVNILLAAGAKQDLRNDWGATALDLAKSKKHWQIAEALEAAAR